MVSLEGGYERPHRPRKAGEFIPIEEVSEEHLSPDWPRPLTPEEIMIQAEEMDEEDAIASQKNIEDDEYAIDEPIEREVLEKNLREAIQRFKDSEEGDDEGPAARKPRLKDEGGMRPTHGWRGKESKSKHKKGSDSIRKKA